MRFRALATDYDGTLASEGRVAADTLAAVTRLRQSGVKLILVTGRHLPDLMDIFPQLEVFHRIVAENGALLYTPRNREELLLGLPPPDQFMHLLGEAGVPFTQGKVVIASNEPFRNEISRIIDKLGLQLRIILNKGAVMVLPPGVDKGSGLLAALKGLGIGAKETVAVGDAENDLDFLEICGYGAAVANSLPMLKERVDLVTSKENGKGLMEVIERLHGRFQLTV